MESQAKLEVLYRQPNYNEVHLLGQWNRQQEQQLRELVVENSATLRVRLSKLVTLAEDLHEAEEELKHLREKRQNDQNPAERTELAQLPERVALLEEKIDEPVAELGGNEYHNTPGARNNDPDNVPNKWMINIVGSRRPRLSDKARAEWQEVAEASILQAEPLDEGEAEEHCLDEEVGDEDVEVKLGEEGEGELDIDWLF
ncbi:uncharacterized protein MELLADRAFT_107047 [Melampsora larici-populina 98AG31]|uniref:Uncharacterized protein n=1 Tax=Melampsora larici-populina (strain 98AG31 / pathotype 3-4-7) TaxID=747676 RepID=F4RNH5_MELLP|nr:uncharacterized protein MELLADRAFT_107047 [Melampsora larici-populina 98AG31]EGG05989.1 hypothetical protein MELLADRAFT_107047 [Melampsora larici-populina 98AG31]